MMQKFPRGFGPRRMSAGLIIIFLIAVSSVVFYLGSDYIQCNRNSAAALKIADYILDLQETNGAIPDAAAADTVNGDSNMEYALIALAAAYQQTGQKKYLSGLESGISWLAAAEEMQEASWQGSWWYYYDRNGRHLPMSGENGVVDVRGVDATSALFVYLLYLDYKCTGSRSFAEDYRKNAVAALEFILTRSKTANGLFANSFLCDNAGKWNRYDCCFAADQGDVWLGLRSGALLYGNADYEAAADSLKSRAVDLLFSEDYHRYCSAIENGQPDPAADGFESVMCQGYLPWLWGNTVQNRQAVNWLQNRVDAASADYSLSRAFLILGRAGIGQRLPDKYGSRLIDQAMDSQSGGIYDSTFDHAEYVNTAAFCVLALLEWLPEV